MIVPRGRLLFWTGAIVLPFSALSALVPARSDFSAGAILILLTVVVIDALLSGRGLRGIDIEFAPVTRLSRGRRGNIGLVAENSGNKKRKVRLGLSFPPALRAESDVFQIDLQGGGRMSFLWPCTPLRRGSYILDYCRVEGSSPLGLWDTRTTRPIRCEVRVYPDLLAERKQLAALFLNRGNLGIHAVRQVGQGRDFEKLREYVHGDSYDHIHWKVTAKRGRPVTKIFQIEKTQEVYVIVDASRLSSRNPAVAGGERSGDLSFAPSILERFVTGAFVMGAAAKRQGDLFGLVTFGSRISRFLRAKSGPAHYNDCREALCEIQPELVNPDFGELFSFLGTSLRKRALLIFLTNLDDPALAESFVDNISLLSRKHLVVVNILRPASVKPLFSDADVKSPGDIYAALGGHIAWHNIAEIRKVLERRGVRLALLDNESLCAQLVSQYMGLKQRQLL